MSLATVYSRARKGIEAPQVTVEVHISRGLPSLTIVGLPETAVKESRDRVRSAILNSQFDMPSRRITVNLAPADLPKEGGCFDLAIAVGILVASGQVPGQQLPNLEIMAELALDGSCRAVAGSLPAAMACSYHKRELMIAQANADQAALVEELTVLPATSLLAVSHHFKGERTIVQHQVAINAFGLSQKYPDFADVLGQTQARRALEIAACGGHNMLLSGPPGTGKTMLAARLPGVLPPLTPAEALQVATIQSVVTSSVAAFGQRPFRQPHHTASAVALVGGGSNPRPGAVTMAHNGVLFLDELPEFQRDVLETLREPLESGRIHIARAKQQVDFPADFQLIAAMNPCPCGYAGIKHKECHLCELKRERYLRKLSGPLLDRIDLHVNVPPVSHSALGRYQPGESSATIQQRVIACRDWQLKRQNCINSKLVGKQLHQHCALASSVQSWFQQAADKLDLSMRSYYRMLKLARTLADCERQDQIQVVHLQEALSYRGQALMGQ